MSELRSRWDFEPPGSTPLRDDGRAFTRADVLAHWTRRQLDAALLAGAVVRLLPDVYAFADHASDAVVIGKALNLWAPRGLVTGALALHLYSDEVRIAPAAHLVVPNGDRMDAPPWVTVHQTGPLAVNGAPKSVRCTTPERALLDAWRYAPPGRGRDVVYQALWARVCTWRQLERELAGAPRLTRRRDLERILAWFAAGATSPLEVCARRETFAGARFRDFEWQVDLDLGSRRARADMLHRRAKLVVELDGEQYHSQSSALRADRARDIDLLAAGYVTVRFGWNEVVHRPEWCRERLQAIVTARLQRAGRS